MAGNVIPQINIWEDGLEIELLLSVITTKVVFMEN